MVPFALAFVIAAFCILTALLVAQPSSLPKWLPIRYIEVYRAWLTLNFTHRYEVAQLESTFNAFGLPVMLTHKGYAASTFRSLWDAAKTASDMLSLKTMAPPVQALKM